MRKTLTSQNQALAGLASPQPQEEGRQGGGEEGGSARSGSLGMKSPRLAPLRTFGGGSSPPGGPLLRTPRSARSAGASPASPSARMTRSGAAHCRRPCHGLGVADNNLALQYMHFCQVFFHVCSVGASPAVPSGRMARPAVLPCSDNQSCFECHCRMLFRESRCFVGCLRTSRTSNVQDMCF